MENQKHKKFLRARELVTRCLAEIQITLNQTMEPARIAIYLEELSNLSEQQIKFAFSEARRKSRFIPQIAELLAFADAYRPPEIDETRAILGRGSKPPGWEPVSLDEIKREIAAKNLCAFPDGKAVLTSDEKESTASGMSAWPRSRAQFTGEELEMRLEFLRKQAEVLK